MNRSMRLNEMIDKLEKYLPLSKIKPEPIPLKPGMSSITGVDNMRYAYDVLSTIQALKEDINQIKEKLVYRVQEGAIVDDNDSNHFVALSNAIHKKGSILLDALNQVMPHAGSQEIYVKLPNTETLDELEKFIIDLNQSFDDHSRRLFNTTLQFNGFDKGTDWIVLSTMMPQFYAYICGFLNICKTWQELRYRQNAAIDLFKHAVASDKDSSKIKNDADKALVDMIKSVERLSKETARTMVVELVEAQAANVSTDKRNEAVNSAMIGMERLLGMVNKGTEISRSLNASPAVKDLLKEPLKLLNHEVKLLPATAEHLDSKSEEKAEKPAESEKPESTQV